MLFLLYTDKGRTFRVSQLENKIGSGLIEEVIDAAQNELELVATMFENRV